MLSSKDMMNRDAVHLGCPVTQEQTSRLSGIPRGSLARMRYDDRRSGVEVSPKLTLADALSLMAAQQLVNLGIPTIHAASAGRLIKNDWQRVVDAFPRAVVMLAKPGADGRLVVVVCEAGEVPDDLTPAAVIVNLTEVYAKALEAAEAWERRQ